jgi:hypothetical protein
MIIRSSCTVPVILVFMYCTRYSCLHVQYPLLLSSCTVPVILVFMYCTRYYCLHVLYPLLLSSCTVPVIIVFMYSTRYYCKILTKLQFYSHSKKYSNIFHDNRPGGSRVVPCGQTDTHDEVNSVFSQFCKGT